MMRFVFDGVEMIPDLVALDSGTRSPGLALFAGQTLLSATNIDVTEYEKLPTAQRWLNIGRELTLWVKGRVPPNAQLLTVVFERPQWYQRHKSKGDPNQLAGLTGVAGVFIGQLSMLYPVFVGSYTPAEWIGQLSKVCPACDGRKGKGRGKNRVVCHECHGSDWETPRGRYIRRHATHDELRRCPDQNDAIDAFGIGLYESQRLAPRHVMSNGHDGR